jgi:hypothetical protein
VAKLHASLPNARELDELTDQYWQAAEDDMWSSKLDAYLHEQVRQLAPQARVLSRRVLVCAVLLTGAEPVRAGAGSRFGAADRMRRDRKERPRRGGRERDTGIAEEDGTGQHPMPAR